MGLRVAVIGHVEHITIGRVPEIPTPGAIAHLEGPTALPGGGGGVAFFQLVNSSAEVVLFSAVGDDDAGAAVRRYVEETGAEVHLAARSQPHTRDVVMIDPAGERTIVVVGQPLHPARADALPWARLGDCDAVYFTGQDPETLVAARAAKTLVVTARRRAALDASRVTPDVIVGSANDPREASKLADYANPPAAVVMTEGAAGGWVETAEGRQRFEAPKVEHIVGGAYGAGDSFAAALTYYLGAGHAVVEACAKAAHHGAAVLSSVNPLTAQRALP